MKILLIDPPRKYWNLFLFNTPSVALAFLSAYLESRGHQVTICDLYGLDRPWDVLEETLRREEPGLVGITCTVAASSYDSIHCAMLIKSLKPDLPVVGGGFMFTSIPEDFINSGYIDFACIGEGEITLGHLADTLEKGGDLSQVLGIARRDGDKVAINKPRPHIEDLSILPYPAWEKFEMDRYSVRPMGGEVALAITCSRGCVNSCAFCSEALLWKSTYRSFSAKWICDNLEILTGKYHKRVFIFGDNDFLYDRERLADFCDEMERRRIRAYFWIEASVASVLRNHDLLSRLRRVGGFNIQLGLETVCPEVLKEYNKPQNLEEMKKAVKLARDNGFSVTGLFIWGDWNDTIKSLRDGVRFISSHADFIAPSIINPFPGTPYHKKCRQEGRIQENNLWKYNQHHVLMPTKNLSVEEAQEVYEKTAYSLPVLLNMIYQALFSPCRPARVWAWEFIMLDLRFMIPKNRIPGGEKFENYLERKGKKMPPWTFPYPRESVVTTPRMGIV